MRSGSKQCKVLGFLGLAPRSCDLSEMARKRAHKWKERTSLLDSVYTRRPLHMKDSASFLRVTPTQEGSRVQRSSGDTPQTRGCMSQPVPGAVYMRFNSIPTLFLGEGAVPIYRGGNELRSFLSKEPCLPQRGCVFRFPHYQLSCMLPAASQ